MTMAASKKGEQILEFARHHRIRVVTIADLVRYRQESESLLTRVCGDPSSPRRRGRLGFIAIGRIFNPCSRRHACHFAMVFGELGDGASVLVRFHKEQLPDDIFYRCFHRFESGPPRESASNRRERSAASSSICAEAPSASWNRMPRSRRRGARLASVLKSSETWASSPFGSWPTPTEPMSAWRASASNS